MILRKFQIGATNGKCPLILRNQGFVKKIESVQYNGALAITGAIQHTSREKVLKLWEITLNKELGLETLSLEDGWKIVLLL